MRVLIGIMLVSGSAAASCPNITAFRSPNILSSFDPQKLNGLWYEQQFIDLAQVGASCQTLNSTYNPQSGEIDMDFRVKYIGKLLPFTIVEQYFAHDEIAYYTKEAKMPGAQLLTLPTVVVDAVLSDDGTQYETMTLYSCINPLGAVVQELVFATRQATVDDSVKANMQAVARKMGIVWDDSRLSNATHDGC